MLRYLTKSFRTALHHIKPDCIIFLGDLMDEGSTSTDAEYDQYKARFDRIFNVEPYKPKVHHYLLFFINNIFIISFKLNNLLLYYR